MGSTATRIAAQGDVPILLIRRYSRTSSREVSVRHLADKRPER